MRAAWKSRLIGVCRSSRVLIKEISSAAQILIFFQASGKKNFFCKIPTSRMQFKMVISWNKRVLFYKINLEIGLFMEENIVFFSSSFNVIAAFFYFPIRKWFVTTVQVVFRTISFFIFVHFLKIVILPYLLTLSPCFREAALPASAQSVCLQQRLMK